MFKINKLIKNIIILVITVILFLLIVEITLRVSYKLYSNFNTEMWRYSVKIKKLSNFSGVSHEHLPNKEGMFYGINIKTNSLGFRDYEYSPKKEKDAKRIIVLGDSITLAWGVNLSNSYPKILEKKLNENNQKYEILNTAVGNYNVEMEVNILEKYLILKPNAVIIGFFPNDAEKTIIVNSGLIYQLKKRFYIYPFFWDRFMRIKYLFIDNQNYTSKIHKFYTDEYGGKKRIKKSFEKLKLLSEVGNFSVFIVIIPSFYNDFNNYDLTYVHQFISNLCEKYNFKCIDSFNKLRNYDLKDIIVSREDAHPNVLGHRLIAESIFEIIKNEDI